MNISDVTTLGMLAHVMHGIPRDTIERAARMVDCHDDERIGDALVRMGKLSDLDRERLVEKQRALRRGDVSDTDVFLFSQYAMHLTDVTQSTLRAAVDKSYH